MLNMEDQFITVITINPIIWQHYMKCRNACCDNKTECLSGIASLCAPCMYYSKMKIALAYMEVMTCDFVWIP